MKRLIPPDLQDLSLWPSVDPNALAGQRQQDLLNRIEAVRQYADGTALSKWKMQPVCLACRFTA